MSEIVSANEAAHRFGLSEKTVRRWISSGKLKADKAGRAYRVSLSEVAALTVQRTPDSAERSPYSGPTPDFHSAPDTADSRSGMYGIAELVALVDRLQAEAREHAAAMWQERARVLGAQLAISAPQDAQNATVDASGSPQTPAPSPRGSHPPRGVAPGAAGGRPPSRR